MRQVGNDIYIQRRESFALDFAVHDTTGAPLLVFKKWENPHLVITVASASDGLKHEEPRVYWLDLQHCYQELSTGQIVEGTGLKTFIGTEPLYIAVRSLADIWRAYIKDGATRMVFDKGSDFDVTNWLFYCDEDGTRRYMYISDYEDGAYTPGDDEPTFDDSLVTWEDYDFRVVKQFATDDWNENKYVYDIKLVSGVSLADAIQLELAKLGYHFRGAFPARPWTPAQATNCVEAYDEDTKHELYAYLTSLIQTTIRGPWPSITDHASCLEGLNKLSEYSDAYATACNYIESKAVYFNPQNIPTYLSWILDEDVRKELQEAYITDLPLLTTTVRTVILGATPIYVSKNLQGGKG